MIINKFKTVNDVMIKDVKKGSPDTTCSDPSVTVKKDFENFEKRFLPTNSKINFRKCYKKWGQNNEPFKSYFKKPDRARRLLQHPTTVEIGLNFSDSSIYS